MWNKWIIVYGLRQIVENVQEGIAVGRSFAMFKNYHIDGNKEMIAFGMMNIAGSCTSCYLTTGIKFNILNFPNSIDCLTVLFLLMVFVVSTWNSRAIFAVSCELQCRMQDSSVEHCYVNGSDDHIAFLNAIVPLHSPCGFIRNHNGCDARSHWLRSSHPSI